MHDDHLLHRRHHPGYGVFELQVCEHGKIFHLERDERSDKLVFMVNYNVDSSIRAPIFFRRIWPGTTNLQTFPLEFMKQSLKHPISYGRFNYSVIYI